MPASRSLLLGPLLLLSLLLLSPLQSVHAQVEATSSSLTPVAQLEKLLHFIKDQSEGASTNSTKATLLSTASPETAQLARDIFGKGIDECEKNLSFLKSIPKPSEHEAFVLARESLRSRLSRQLRLLSVAKEGESLARSLKKAKQIYLHHLEVTFYDDIASALRLQGNQLEKIWKSAIPSNTRRKAIEAEVFRARSQRMSSQKEEVLARAKEQEAALAQKVKESKELEIRAQEELDRAITKDEQILAKLRLTFARLDAVLEDAKVKALRSETRTREAEEALEISRADVASRIPVLLRLKPTVARRVKAQTKLKEMAKTLFQQSKVLAKEVELAQENVPTLRAQTHNYLKSYDALEEGLKTKKSRKIYRQQVYFARLVHRRSAAGLDEFRTDIEWKRRLRSHLLEHGTLLSNAEKELESHEESRWLGQTEQQWKNFATVLFLTFLGAWLIYPLFRQVFHGFASKTRWNWDNIILEESATPVRGIIALLGIWIALTGLTLSPSFLKNAVTTKGVLWAIWAGFVTWRILNVVIRIITPKIEETETTLDDQLLHFLSRALRAVIIFVSGLYILQAFGWKIANVLAGLGIGGLAFALAAKDTLANLFGSIVLFMDRPFTVGNWVIISGAEGIVEDIGIRSTRIRTFKDTIVTIPNAIVANTLAENIHSFRKRRLYFTLELRFDTSPAKIKATVDRIREILTDHPMVLDGYYVYVTGIKDSGVEIMVYCFVGTRDWGKWMHYSQEVYLTVLEALEELKVGLAYPTQTIEIETPKPPVELQVAMAMEQVEMKTEKVKIVKKKPRKKRE